MVSRRTFLATSTAAAGALVAPAPFADLAAQSVPRRRRISELSNTDPVVRTYREGVRRLKAASGPVNWNAIAKVHADFCPHGNWYFVPWHRAYLVMVENIIRDVTGDRSFAMPYWDWSSDRRIPEQFNRNAVANNPLFEPSRTMTPQMALPDAMVGPRVISAIMAASNFEVFGSSRPDGQDTTDASWIREAGTDGPLESNPHNGVHGSIGGVMGTYDSPRDPVFWLHHCNIDRLWAQWNQDGNLNTGDELWRDMLFENHFFRPDGNRYSVSVRDLLEILPLGYRYGLGNERPRQPQRDPPLILSSNQQTARGSAGRGRSASGTPGRRFSVDATAITPGRPLTVSLPVGDADVRPALGARAGRSASASTDTKRVLAVVRDIKAPAEAVSTRINVFIDTGENATTLTSSSPSFAGTFGFFGSGHGGHAGHGGRAARGGEARDTRSVLLDLTPALSRLAASGRPAGDKISLTFVAEPVKAGDTAVAVQPGRVDISVE